MEFLEMFIVISLCVSCFFGGALAQNMVQRSERHDENERTLRRVVKYLNDTAPSA